MAAVTKYVEAQTQQIKNGKRRELLEIHDLLKKSFFFWGGGVSGDRPLRSVAESSQGQYAAVHSTVFFEGFSK